MSTLTARGIACTPLLLTLPGGATLESLLAQINDKRYTGTEIPGSGWGSVLDDNDRLGSHIARSPGGVARISEAGFLEARYYADVLNKSLLRVLDSSAEQGLLFPLQAWDVLVEPPEAGAATTWVSTRNQNELRATVKAAVESLGSIAVYGSNAGNLPPDFFLWLVYRYLHAPDLSSDLSIKAIRSVTATDALRRSSRIDDKAAMDRMDLLAHVAMESSSFGPVKMPLHDKGLGLRLDFELHESTAFQIHVTNSEYEPHVEVPGSLKLEMARDTILTVIPALRSAHRLDEDWGLSTRRTFVRACYDAIVARFPAQPPPA